MKRLLLALSIALASCWAPAQTVDLLQKYGVPMWNSGPLSAKYTLVQAQSKFKALFTWLKYKGATDAEIMALNEVAAAWNNEVWATDGYVAPYVQDAYPQNGCQSRAIIDARGIYQFKTNIPCLISFGQYLGAGSGNYSDGSGSTGGTRIEIDHAGWFTRLFPERFCMQTVTWNDDTILGYAESFYVAGFRLEGGWTSKVNDPSFISAGMGIWDSGETSKIERVYAFGFNTYGFMNVRGTPTIFDGCSAFSNGIFGFGLIGNDLSTITILAPSGDDNGALIGVRSGYGRPGGGTVTVTGSGKSESGKRTPARKQRFFDGQGAVNLVINAASLDAMDGPDYCIVVDFQTYNGQVDAHGFRYNGYQGLLKLTAKGTTTTYSGPGSTTPISFTATEGGVSWSSRPMTGSGGGTTCTWILGTETCGTCTNNTQTCTTPYVSSVSGCTPSAAKPASQTRTQACGTVPPTSAKFTGGPYTVTANTFFVSVSPAVTTTKVVLTGFKPTSLSWGRILGTGGTSGGLMIDTNGDWWWNNGKLSGVPRAVVNVSANYTINLPTSGNVSCLFQTQPGQGGAQLGTVQKIELY